MEDSLAPAPSSEMEYDLSVISRALWSNLRLQEKIDGWAERNGINLKPIHRIEPTSLPAGRKRKLPKSLEELEEEYRKLDSGLGRAEFLDTLSNIYKEDTSICFFKDWLEQGISNLKESILSELEQKFIFAMVKYKIGVLKQIQAGPKLFLEDDHENPFFDCLSSQKNGTESLDDQEEELIDLAEKVALEQALYGKTAQQLEDIIEILIPISNFAQSPSIDKVRRLRRTLYDILGGKHEEPSEASSPIKGKSPRPIGRNISVDIFKKRHRERNPLRRLSDKDLMLKRILDHRVISMDELSQSQSNRKCFSIEHSSQSRPTNRQNSQIPTPTQGIVMKGSSPLKTPHNDGRPASNNKSNGIFKFKKLSATPKEDIELSVTQ